MSAAQGEDLFATTPLVPVANWGWGLYRASYWRDEAHATTGLDPVLQREFVESENGVDGFLCYGEYADDHPESGWPLPRCGSTRPGWVTWELVRTCTPGEVRFVSGGHLGGTRVIGAGWRTPLGPSWYA